MKLENSALIISTQSGDSEDFIYSSRKSRGNSRDSDYKVGWKAPRHPFNRWGYNKAEQMLELRIFTKKGIKYVHYLETAVRAQALFERDRDWR